jgi:hypothetical protein
MLAPIRVEPLPDRVFVDTVHCVGRLTLLKEYTFLCRLFVRFILLPARIITGRPCSRLSDYALLKWKYSGVHLQNACTSFDCAVEESRRPYYFHVPVPVDDSLPHEASVFGQHSFPLSPSYEKYLSRRADVVMVPRATAEAIESAASVNRTLTPMITRETIAKAHEQHERLLTLSAPDLLV